MRLPDLIRYSLWGSIVATAEANRRHYHMATTWLPHLLTNSLTLLLPEIYRAASAQARRRRKPSLAPTSSTSALAEAERIAAVVFDTLVRDNPAYVVYVTPLAIGYLLSHPRLNIYKGRLGKLRLAGFGLDALPHATTALALTALVYDTTSVAAKAPTPESPLGGPLRWSARHQALLSAAILMLATIGWEIGEYLMFRHEMDLRGDRDAINMQWSVPDMLSDCAANTIGWGLALVWRVLSSKF